MQHRRPTHKFKNVTEGFDSVLLQFAVSHPRGRVVLLLPLNLPNAHACFLSSPKWKQASSRTS